MLAHARSGRVLAVLALFLIPAGGFAAWAVAKTGGDEGDSGSPPPPPPVSTQNAQIMTRSGLSAEAICAAGVTQAQQVTALVSAVEAVIALDPNALTALDEDFSAKKVTYDQLLRTVQSGLATPQQIAQLPVAKSELDAAEAAREGYKASLRSTGLATVSPSVAALVNAIYANRDWSELAVQYRVESRPDADWVLLREALATERVAAQYGEPFPASAQSYLASVNAGAAVSAAKVNLDTYLFAVQTSWNAAASN